MLQKFLSKLNLTVYLLSLRRRKADRKSKKVEIVILNILLEYIRHLVRFEAFRKTWNEFQDDIPLQHGRFERCILNFKFVISDHKKPFKSFVRIRCFFENLSIILFLENLTQNSWFKWPQKILYTIFLQNRETPKPKSLAFLLQMPNSHSSYNELPLVIQLRCLLSFLHLRFYCINFLLWNCVCVLI